jgi:predicted helicase
MAYPRSPLMNNALQDNRLLLFIRNSRRGNVNNYFVANSIVDKDAISPFDNVRFAPLYLYTTDLGGVNEKSLNLREAIVSRAKETVQDLTPETMFDYIYAILYSEKYREKYSEFLKIDFPRIPYPKDSRTFHALAEKGAELRALRLLESPTLDNFITSYPVDGNHAVDKPVYKNGNVYINADQYFGNVPEIAWNFYIGGYQPAQKWLKDRKGRNLSIDDILHYQRVIVALAETHRIMQEIDSIKFLLEG